MDNNVPSESLPPTPTLATPEYFAPLPPPDPAAGLWTLRSLFLFLGFAVVALFSSNLLVVTGYTLLKPWFGWHLSDRALGENPFFLLVLQSVFYLFILGYLYLLVAINYRQPFWRALAWRRPRLKQVLVCLAGGVLLAGVVLAAPSLLPEAPDFPLEHLFSSPAAGYAVGSFAILVAPLMEELVFRGLLFGIFESRVGLRFAVLVTAVLFAGLHVPEYWGAWNHALMILVVGLAFSFARGLTGSLAPSIILHVAYNSTMMTGLYFATSRFHNLQTFLGG